MPSGEPSTHAERRAYHDSLTGLPTRSHLVRRLASLDRRRLPDTALVFLDLDDFKDVNNSHGHAIGDDLLRSVAARVRACIRDGDLMVRLGGDEFAVLLEGSDAGAAAELAARIADAMREPFLVGGHPTNFTASIGIAAGTPAGAEPEELLRFADLAMYEAKAKGKGRWATFDAAMSDALTLRTRTARELHEAIERDELVLHYQPMIDLTTGYTVSLEALVRWQHPVRGLLGADEFVPLAERTDAIIALGAWVLKTACLQADAWRRARPDRPAITVAVNVSAAQLDDPAFVATVSAALEATGLPAGGLCLEVTETAVMRNPSDAQRALDALRGLGIRLAIDDFGTGYASLTYLRRLHATTVKIDQSFVDGLGRDLEDTTIVAAVIGLTQALGLTVTAEGVESVVQLDILREMGCQFAQGFLLCRPAPAEEATRQLDQRWFDPGTHVGPSNVLATDDGEPAPAAGGAAPPRRFRVVVAHSSAGARVALREQLEAKGHFDVVGETADGDVVVQLAAARQPHLVLLDQTVTKVDGLAVLPRILLAAPGTKVVLLSGHATPGSVDRALAIGAAGLFKTGVADLAGELLPLAEGRARPAAAR